jgi:hypothetical protein
MESTTDYLQHVKTKILEAPEPLCPLCGASLILLRGFFRCQQCCFSICECCDSSIGEAEQVG